MAPQLRRRFRADRHGTVTVRLADEERSLIGEIIEQLRELLMTTSSAGEVEPSLRRLYPTAYPDDEQRDAEFQELMRDQLLARRLENLEVVEATLDAEVLDGDQASAWMAAVNDARLVLGTRLDVSEEDLPPTGTDDPLAYAHHVYHYLGALLDELVRSLDQTLEE